MYLYRRAALQERLHTETNYMYTIKKKCILKYRIHLAKKSVVAVLLLQLFCNHHYHILNVIYAAHFW